MLRMVCFFITASLSVFAGSGHQGENKIDFSAVENKKWVDFDFDLSKDSTADKTGVVDLRQGGKKAGDPNKHIRPEDKVKEEKEPSKFGYDENAKKVKAVLAGRGDIQFQESGGKQYILPMNGDTNRKVEIVSATTAAGKP